jgi:hypothetical protein
MTAIILMSAEDRALTHAKRRFAERYGRSLTTETWEDHHLAILGGESVLVCRQFAPPREIHLIDDAIIAVFDSGIRRIVTYLPIEDCKVYRDFLRRGRPLKFDRVSNIYRKEMGL